MGETVLEARGLHKAFGGVRAVRGVSVRLAQGEVTAVIGPNGAGKTTLFNLLAGALAPDAGAIRFRGADVTALPPHAMWRRGLGRTFQIAGTFASLSVLQNVQSALFSWEGRRWDAWSRARDLAVHRAQALLAQVGLAPLAHEPSRQLSLGDLKRLELAIALANDPVLLLLDEPTAGMAPPERAALIALVVQLVRARGLTVLFTEHDMDVVFAAAQRILVLHQGATIADGPPDAIRNDAVVQEVYLGPGSPDAERAR